MGKSRRLKPPPQSLKNRSALDMASELTGKAQRPGPDYRERSLTIHGLICAKCAREFDESNKSLLTVHHKDGNRYNNPPNGSNWENLCTYCHEDEHSRRGLSDYFSGDR